MIILLKKFLYVLFINVLGIDLRRQCLLIIFLLSFFLFLEIKRTPYFTERLNNLSKFSQAVLIYTLWVCLFTREINLEEFEHFKSISIIVSSILFFISVIITMISGYCLKLKKFLNRTKISYINLPKKKLNIYFR